MKDQNSTAYSRIDSETIQIVRKSVVRATRNRWHDSNQQDDIVQQILVVLMRRSEAFDIERGSWRAFVRSVAERELRVILYRRKTATSQSLHFQEETLEIVDASVSGPAVPGEMEEAVQAAVSQLSDELRELCESFLKNPDVRSLSSQRGVSRSTIYRRFVSMRSTFREYSLNEYL